MTMTRHRFFTVIAALAAGLLAGCAGPSKARYVELLHECREANREHLRMLQEYDKRPMFDMSGCAKMENAEGWLCPNSATNGAPEQTHGAVEMGLGGF
jgi:hypothetical protein